MDKETGLDALVSVFLRYPELSAVKFDAFKDIIKIEIALNTNLSSEQDTRFIDACSKSMTLFHRMRQLNPIHMSLKFVEHAGITILRLYRDSQTLLGEEIELFINLVRQEFASWLIRDDNDMVGDSFLSGDEKKQVLNKIKLAQESFRNLFVYRDKGRVFVFNR